ncbi:MAG: hypothetical protein CV087_16325 [Candidatus Brocadia sp. WS118]|nr:MAG: hypothetical protein CV087_16325 [Candidatus Brocadia sp. WS118]
MKSTCITIFLLVLPVVAQGEQGDCKQRIVISVKNLQKIGKPEPGKVHHLEFNVEATARYTPSNVNNMTKSLVDITITNDQYFYDSDFLSIWTDQQDQFMIMHPKKLIIKSKPSKDIQKIDYRQQMIMDLQDRILDNTDNINCQEIDMSNELITIQPNQKIRDSHFIDKIEYTLDRKDHAIHEVTVYYLEPYKLIKQRVEYLALETNIPYSTDLIDKKRVYEANGLINEKYKNYQIVDQGR